MCKEEFEPLARAVLDDLSIIHGWATLCLIDTEHPVTRSEPMKIIQTTASRTAQHLQDYLQSHPQYSG